MAELKIPSQAPGSSISQDCRTLKESAGSELNQTDLKQQPLHILAAVISSLQFEVQLMSTLEVLQAESRLAMVESSKD